MTVLVVTKVGATLAAGPGASWCSPKIRGIARLQKCHYNSPSAVGKLEVLEMAKTVKDTILQVRMPSAEKREVAQAAQRAGVGLSEFTRQVLLRAARAKKKATL